MPHNRADWHFSPLEFLDMEFHFSIFKAEDTDEFLNGLSRKEPPSILRLTCAEVWPE